ncbi:MAG: J domain-containing protein [Acidobacteriota bacterium]|jgi:hypothetical protein|nr:J domain-containing protein [Acidobacteriota bacterium]
MKAYVRRKKSLEKLDAELCRNYDDDMTGYRKFLAQVFGAEMTQLRTLREKFLLAQSRYDKIDMLARDRRMSKERYGAVLRSMTPPEADVWDTLESELKACMEERRKQKEAAFARIRQMYDDAMGENDAEEGAEGDEDDFCDPEFDDAGSGGGRFDGLHGEGREYGADPEGVNRGGSPYMKEVKKLYRELCLRYHPDKIGAHDVRTQRLWNAVQDAYQDGDLQRLRSIYAGCELEAGGADLRCSEIDDGIFDLECAIRELRAELRARKRTPFWGFATWTEAKREQAEISIRAEFDNDLRAVGLQLQWMEAELERILTSYKDKPKKPSARESRKAAMSAMPRLFD